MGCHCLLWVPSGLVCNNCLLLFRLSSGYRHGSLTYSVSLVPLWGWWQESRLGKQSATTYHPRKGWRASSWCVSHIAQTLHIPTCSLGLLWLEIKRLPVTTCKSILPLKPKPETSSNLLSLNNFHFILHFLEDVWTFVRICWANRIVVPGMLYSHHMKLDFRTGPKEPWNTAKLPGAKLCSDWIGLLVTNWPNWPLYLWSLGPNNKVKIHFPSCIPLSSILKSCSNFVF